ncbi:MAG: hypothetical protein AAGH15_05280 [Myxococcota bacterium]
MRFPARLAPLALLLAACGGATASAPAPVAPVTVATLEVPPDKAVVPPEVRLISAGEAPHAPLRFRPEKGLTQRLRMEMDMTMETQVVGGFPQRIEAPTTTSVLRQAVTDVAADGTFRLEFGIESIEVGGDGPLRAAMIEALEPLTTMQGWSIGDARGRVLGLDFRLAGDVPATAQQSLDSIRDALRQMLPSLPEEPVGVGAEWEVVQPFVTSALTFEQTARFRLLRREGDRVELAVTIAQRAEPQPLQSPQPGMSVRLESFQGGGEATTAYELGGRFLRSETHVLIEMQSVVSAGAQTAQSQVRMETNARVQEM